MLADVADHPTRVSGPAGPSNAGSFTTVEGHPDAGHSKHIEDDDRHVRARAIPQEEVWDDDGKLRGQVGEDETFYGYGRKCPDGQPQPNGASREIDAAYPGDRTVRSMPTAQPGFGVQKSTFSPDETGEHTYPPDADETTVPGEYEPTAPGVDAVDELTVIRPGSAEDNTTLWERPATEGQPPQDTASDDQPGDFTMQLSNVEPRALDAFDSADDDSVTTSSRPPKRER